MFFMENRVYIIKVMTETPMSQLLHKVTVTSKTEKYTAHGKGKPSFGETAPEDSPLTQNIV